MRIFVWTLSVTLRPRPLKSETGWTGELWLQTNLLNWQNKRISFFFSFFSQKHFFLNLIKKKIHILDFCSQDWAELESSGRIGPNIEKQRPFFSYLKENYFKNFGFLKEKKHFLEFFLKILRFFLKIFLDFLNFSNIF